VASGTGPNGSQEASATLTVTPASSALGRLGAISGAVVDAASALPIGSVCVQAFSPGGSIVAGHAMTNSSGGYRITGLGPGSYTVRFAGCGASPYQPVW